MSKTARSMSCPCASLPFQLLPTSMVPCQQMSFVPYQQMSCQILLPCPLPLACKTLTQHTCPCNLSHQGATFYSVGKIAKKNSATSSQIFSCYPRSLLVARFFCATHVHCQNEWEKKIMLVSGKNPATSSWSISLCNNSLAKWMEKFI